MAEAFQFADDLGPAKALHILEPALGLRAILVHTQGILTVPDFIANAGGVICAAVEYRGGTHTAAFEAIGEKIRANTDQVLEQARCAKLLPRQAAEDMALRRVRSAMRYRRWS